MSADKIDEQGCRYDITLVLCRYDKNHELMFVQQEDIIDIYTSRDQRDFKPEPNHKRIFLSTFELTERDLIKFDSQEALLAHMRQIRRKYFCSAHSLKGKGVRFLADIKNGTIAPYVGDGTRLMDDICNEWVSDSSASNPLPVLETIKTILKYSIYRDHYQSSLSNTLLIIVQQGFSTVVPMIRALLELNVPAHNIVLFTKPHTTNSRTKEKFERITGIHYVTGVVDESRVDGYNHAIELCVRRVISAAQGRLLQQSLLGAIQNMVVHDEGGVLLKFKHFSDFLKGDQDRYHLNISLSEHTVSGLKAQEDAWPQLQLPYISMAQSWLKADHESFFIAEESFDIAQETIHSLMPNKKSIINIGIIGCGGNIGSAFIRCFMNAQSDLKRFKLHISEKNRTSVKYESILRLMSHAGVTFSIHENNVTLLQQSDLVFSCTGTSIITPEIGEALSGSWQKHRVTLCNLASGDREFRGLLDYCTPSADVIDYHCQLGEISFVIKNRGRPIIFNGRDDAVHPLKIDIIRSGTLITLIQHFAYLSNVNTARSDGPQDRIILLDAILQYAICQSSLLTQNILKSKGLAQFCLSQDVLLALEAVDVKKIIERSEGALIRQIEVAEPSLASLIGRFDKNHSLHLLADYQEGEFEYCFMKHNTKISDHNMLGVFLNNYDFSIEQFYTANFVDKLSFFQSLFHRINHTYISTSSVTFFTPISSSGSKSYGASEGCVM